ncbi:MAG TPA: 2'-5' RNA ligase family protein [Kineosporiaceae bacterium]|nr:2'-5' RNA ligase family protein [Kineosporiaceae bacterium]
MVQSVELLLDDELDAAVRAQWQALADAGLPSQARHTGSSNRPHVTLAVTATTWPEPVEARLSDAAASGLPLRVRLGGLIVFGHGPRHVLARLIVPSSGLLALHAAICDVVADAPGGVAHTGPGEWTPHVTLARQLTVRQFPTALASLAGPAARPREPEGVAVAVRRWDGVARREWLIAGG